MTQRQNDNLNRVFINNMMWLAASVLLAFLVWVVSVTQADPISEQRYRTRIPIQVELDEGITVVDQPTTNVWVTIRAQASVQENLTAEDIIVRADLTGYGAGTHTVELETELARRGIADTQPRQITVTLEEIQVQQIQVTASIPSDQDVPPNFTRQPPTFSDAQVMVRGVSSRVQQVVTAQATLDLRDQRNTFRSDVRLTPVDADGNVVSDVTIEPQFVEVTVEIRQRDDLREVSVSPRIDTNSLSEGYTLSAISYEPQTVFLIGPRVLLSDVTTPLTTELIDLSGRTEPFEITVPVVFNGGVEFPILGDNTSITVYLEIRAQTATRQFENIAVELVGLDETLHTAQASLENVVVLVTGPAPEVRDLTDDDLQVVLDLSGLVPGTYDLTPRAILQAQIDSSGVTINPATITVTVAELEPEADEDE